MNLWWIWASFGDLVDYGGWIASLATGDKRWIQLDMSYYLFISSLYKNLS